MFSVLNDKIVFEEYLKLQDNVATKLKESLLVLDSKKATQDSIFCAYKGTHIDGNSYIQHAIDNGSSYIITDASINLAQVQAFTLKNLAQYIGLLAAYKYDTPSAKLKVIGVTGTNGKTSITYWLNQVYTNMQIKSAIIGTTGAGIYPHIKSFDLTTPDPITLQQFLLSYVQQDVQMVAMEVSSIALTQGRVNGTQFNTAIFTNLTQDHLDYHITIENYFEAKRSLFYWHGLKNVIINIDDKYGVRLYNELIINNPELRVLSYGINGGDVCANNLKISIHGTEFTLTYNGDEIVIKAPVIGKFNVYNLLAVISYLIIDGISLHDIQKYIMKVHPVKGRMDAIFTDNKPLVIVDYAHTPDALENVLSTLNEIEHKGQIFCVFGCGGERDTSKRQLMGAIATKNADYVVVTSDNPRHEDPNEIIKQIVSAIPLDKTNYHIELNRCDAIKHAILKASANDIILIAGKGHEEYQDIQGIKYEFSDFNIAREFLK